MVRNSKTLGKSEAKRDFNLVPKAFSLKNEKALGTRQRSWFQTSRWRQILKWPPKREHISRTDEVSNLYSVVKILSEFRTPCVLFTSTRTSKSRPLGSQMIKEALDVRVFEPFDWGRGIIGTTERIQGYSSPPCWEALKNVLYNNRRFCYLMIHYGIAPVDTRR